MADESFDGSTDDLIAEIRKMEKEKEEIEKKNQERQKLEQRYKQLKGNVSSLKSGKNSSSQSNSRSTGGNSSSDSILTASLEESQARLRTLQESVLRSPHANTSLREEEDDFNRSHEEFEDDVMSEQHKHALRQNRDVLVENMTPDDIFNDLISKHILSNADVSRIKEKNTVEAINEELLNILVRRSDRAFSVFVASLRRTLQGWLANRLEPVTESKGKRKRRTGELNVDVECDRVMPRSKKRYACTCQEVEEQILVMAKVAFSHIRRRDGTAAAFEQFKKELHQTNEVVKDSMEILHSLKILCRHGELSDLSEGSVRFIIRCSSFASCRKLWEEYKNGTILQAFEESIISPSLLRICGAKRISLHVRISRLEYLTCALELCYQELKMSSCHSNRLALLHLNRKTGQRKRLYDQRRDENSPSCAIPVKRTTSQSQRIFKEISPNILSSGVSSKVSFRDPTSKPLASSLSISSNPRNMDYDGLAKENIPNDLRSQKHLPSRSDLHFIYPSSVDDIHRLWQSATPQHSPVYKTRSKTIERQANGVYYKSSNTPGFERQLKYFSTSGYNLRHRSIRT